MKENVFRINMKCGNCGAEFSKEFPAKTEIREEHSWPHNYVRKYLGEYIVCPVCEEKGHLTITSREPIVKQPDMVSEHISTFGKVIMGEIPRERAGREMFERYNELWMIEAPGGIPDSWRDLQPWERNIWIALRKQYVPRRTISDEELIKILRKAWHKAADEGWPCEARAARKVLLGEETP